MNEQDFYPAGGRGTLVTAPADLPRWISQDRVYLDAAGPATHDSGQSAFWDAIDFDGATVNVSVANSWTQIVNISGAGILGNVVASHGFNASNKVIGIRITVDGVVWTWQETVPGGWTYRTMVLGAIAPSAIGSGAYFPTTNRVLESGGFLEDTGHRLAPVSFLHSVGAPVLAFSESLRVEVRNQFIGSSAMGRRAGCTFVLR